MFKKIWNWIWGLDKVKLKKASKKEVKKATKKAIKKYNKILKSLRY